MGYMSITSGEGGPADISAAWPVGSVYLSVVSTSPSTLLGFGTWVSIGAGRVLVGFDAGDADFDTLEETGGGKTATPSGTVSQPTFTGQAVSLTHSGAAVADHASHTHTYSQVVNHTHTVTVTDPGHSHTYKSLTSTTGSATSYEHGAVDTSSTEANEGEGVDSATTGITASTTNPAGGVAQGTTNGPSVTLSHSVTQPDAHSHTPAGTVSQPTFTGASLSVVQPYFVVRMWKRTA